jgi:hypothetical protein
MLLSLVHVFLKQDMQRHKPNCRGRVCFDLIPCVFIRGVLNKKVASSSF